MSDDDETAGAPRTPQALAPGEQLGKYTLERVLGRGGMGIVWAARDPDLERHVAIKLLHGTSAAPELRARLLREARAMARLKHPNVITVYEVDSEGDRDFIAMELVEGTSMAAWLEAQPPDDEVWSAVLAAGRGLAAAHAAGLVHRDFKPHNVLRSRDGRVIVTDFGLARGLGEDHAAVPPVVDASASMTGIAETLPAPATSSRSGVDSTLTAPGQLMGTPAYMAPEQFAGASPDPRTDQFAFCITAWQALSGTRPFRGESLDELREAAGGGVANVPAKLPRAVRVVLARGLDPDPSARWPDLDALLDALERARSVPKRRRAIGFAVFGLVAAGVLFVAMQRGKPHATVETGCDAQATFDAWTPARRTALEQRLKHHPNAIAIADAFDQFRTAWIDRFHAACKAGSGAKQTARINCLLGERDDLDGLARLTDTVPASAINGFDLWGFLPALEACDGDSPVAPPLLPEQRKIRDQVVALRAQLAASRDPEALMKREDKLVDAAKRLGWKPLLAEIAVAVGSAAQQIGELDTARVRFETAAEDALRLADYKVEAAARIGLFEVEMTTTADPTDDKRGDKLLAQAFDAVQRAGNDPALTASVESLRARYEVSRGELDKAIQHYEAVRAKLVRMNALRVAAATAAGEIEALMQRGDDKDLATAWQLGLDTERALEAAHRPADRRALSDAMIELAWRRGDLAALHARSDALPPVGWARDVNREVVLVNGTVIGVDGTPVEGATVVAWEGVLEGDATRAYTRSLAGMTSVTDDKGAFALQAPRRGGIVAELGQLRSLPMPVPERGRATLKLAATHTLRGEVLTSTHDAIDAWAEIEVAPNVAWHVRAPVGSRRFELANMPAAKPDLTLATRDGAHLFRTGAFSDGRTLPWPSAPALDIIVRGEAATTRAAGLVVLHGRDVPKTAAELDRRAATAVDVAMPTALRIGLADATAEGRKQYRRGDLHAVVRDMPNSGAVTVCEANRQDPTAPVPCATTTLGNQPTVLVLSVR